MADYSNWQDEYGAFEYLPFEDIDEGYEGTYLGGDAEDDIGRLPYDANLETCGSDICTTRKLRHLYPTTDESILATISLESQAVLGSGFPDHGEWPPAEGSWPIDPSTPTTHTSDEQSFSNGSRPGHHLTEAGSPSGSSSNLSRCGSAEERLDSAAPNLQNPSPASAYCGNQNPDQSPSPNPTPRGQKRSIPALEQPPPTAPPKFYCSFEFPCHRTPRARDGFTKRCSVRRHEKYHHTAARLATKCPDCGVRLCRDDKNGEHYRKNCRKNPNRENR